MSTTSDRNLNPLVNGIFENSIMLIYTKYLIIRTQRMTLQVAAGSAFCLVLVNWLHIGTKQKNINRTDSTGVYMMSDCFIYCSTLRASLTIVNTVCILVCSWVSVWIKPFITPHLCDCGTWDNSTWFILYRQYIRMQTGLHHLVKGPQLYTS